MLRSIIGRGAAASVSAYAALRDQQLAEQAAQHFSFIAHEIRNPLHSARLAAQVLASVPESDREEHRKRLERALSQLEQTETSYVGARIARDATATKVASRAMPAPTARRGK